MPREILVSNPAGYGEGVTNSAGANVYALSDGINLVGGLLSEDGAGSVVAAGDVLPDGNGTRSLGAVTNAYTGLFISSGGPRSLHLLPTITVSNRIITFPNESGTVCTTGSVGAGYQPAGNYPTIAASANTIPKSDGTNLVASRITDDGTFGIAIDSGAQSTHVGDFGGVANSTVFEVNDAAKTITATADPSTGVINLSAAHTRTTLPTSDPHVAGELWNNLDAVQVSNG